MNELARRLGSLSVEAATAALTRCCGAHRWVEGMLARRPWATDEALFAAADEVWNSLAEDDWREAFSHHPRIGERRPAVNSPATAAWSSEEQSAAAQSSQEVKDRLAQLNRRYDERFGHLFLICASGRSGEEILAELERRLGQEPAVELAEAAAEQAKITRLRLARLSAELAAATPLGETS